MYLVVWHCKSTLTDHYEAFDQLSDAQTHYASLTDDTSVWSASITVPIESTDYEVNTMEKPESPYEALVMALKLGLDAPDMERSDKAVQMAESLIQETGLTEIDVARAKREVADWWKQQDES